MKHNIKQTHQNHSWQMNGKGTNYIFFIDAIDLKSQERGKYIESAVNFGNMLGKYTSTIISNIRNYC